jgi:hypothetical protein
MALPGWTEDLRRRYLRGEASQFVLHGNVGDLVLHDGRFLALPDFLADVVLAPTKDVVVRYDLSSGVRFAKRGTPVEGAEELQASRTPARALPLLEALLLGRDRVAVVLEYAELLAPAAEASFSTEADRQSVIALHRWSYAPELEKADSLVVLVTESLSDLNARVAANPRAAAVRVPMPDLAARREAIDALLPAADEAFRVRLAEVTAGLKLSQVKAILAGAEADRDAALRLVLSRKREIVERECFGLVEFVGDGPGFDAVGGMEDVKRELVELAAAMRDGRTGRLPMGLLFTGPMGTGKTFVAEAFAREAGLTALKLKNFRSKWVGATEGNLERILAVVQALGQAIIIVDEGDRAFGAGEGESDGGTSSRVIARIKEFMSDTRNRGRVLFIVMTNRPDRLDVDLKRAGRLDRKIPFLYPQEPVEVEAVLTAQLRRHAVAHALAFPRDREAVSARLVGWSNAEIEAVVLLAAGRAGSGPASAATFGEALRDYLPSRDDEMLEFMELLAVFEASSRSLLPRKYAGMSEDELRDRLSILRAKVGGRR